MTFDEFLLSKDTNYLINGERQVLKVKYNDNIDFLYFPTFGMLEYGNKLDFIGMFEKNTKKLYGDSYYLKGSYYKELSSNFYECSISQIYNNVVKEANILLQSYIENNKIELMNSSNDLFEKYISFNNNYNEIERSAKDDYIYGNDSKVSFSVDSYKLEHETKEIVMQYIQNPHKTVEKVYNQYINNTEKDQSLRWYENLNPYYNVTTKEYIGVRLLQQKLYEKLRKNLEINPYNNYQKQHEIIKSIKDIDAQMLTLTIKHDDNIITLKYPKSTLYDLDFYESKISNPQVREQLGQLYKNLYGYEKDKLFINEITKIEYGRKVLYEDSKLIDKNTPDIVDDMFE